MTGRPFALLRTTDQWLRAAHEGTALDTAAGVVGLAWTLPDIDDQPRYRPPLPGGLAFDSACRLYRSVPRDGRIERVRWAELVALPPGAPQPAPADLLERPARGRFGEFVADRPAPGPLDRPHGIAIDADDRLYVAESGARRIVVVDVEDRRVLRTVSTAPSRPLAVACHGRRVLALLDDPPGLVLLEARRGPPLAGAPALPAGVNPSRIACSPSGRVALLEWARSRRARVWLLDGSGMSFPVPRATDLAFAEDDLLVVARYPGEDFRRFRVRGTTRDELAPLAARGYDGFGIVRAPDGRIAFWTTRGVRHAVAARVRYVGAGRVTTFRLDSGVAGTQWGRVFLDACVPPGCTVHLSCVTADEPGDAPALPRTPPANVAAAEIRRPDLSPPLPPVDALARAVAAPVHRRATGRELPWARFAAGDDFETVEAPVLAGPGRYLWVAIDLAGKVHVTPRVRCVRAEHPSHDLLRRLPRTYSRDARAAEFLRRYLAPVEGELDRWDLLAATRAVLLDPCATPAELLPWLAGFSGLVLDERWPEATRRAIVAEVTPLFRARGTLRGLTRFLELFLGVPVTLVEQFRVRGMGGALLGGTATAPAFSNAILGGGFRVGGATGTAEDTPLAGTLADGFATHAHRFTVLVPTALDADRLGAVRHILDLHRPAHTLVEVCVLHEGMRVGRSLHAGLSSIVGRGGGFRPLRLGATPLGRDAILGRPPAGSRAGLARVGHDVRVG